MNKSTLAFIGGGNMATSLIAGLLAKDYPAKNITASDPLKENRERLSQQFGINATSDNNQAVDGADVIILAIKPQVMKHVAQGIQVALAHRPLVISIAAGIAMSSLQEWLRQDTPIVRCMPNTPALVQTGAAGLFANAQVSPAQQTLAGDILNAVGISCWLEREDDIDAVTAVSGSGPAYFFFVMEAMEQVGIELGLTQDVSRKLTLQTALGAAKMAAESNVDSTELRRRVTSPGGTTQRAIETFVAGDITGLFRKAMTSAVERAQEMAKEMEN
ncbi:MAG: pyrroline-5-carboxylate reductase [Porticoccus sp.]